MHVAASGTVASAGWEGGFGNKIDVDHGNGYHTWYCAFVATSAWHVGQHVVKGEAIAAAGATGDGPVRTCIIR